MKSSAQEKLAITETITLYFSGAHYGDTSQLETAFHPDAHITGFIGNEIQDWTRSDFINRVVNASQNVDKSSTYNKQILSIDHTANTATVKARVVVGDLIFIDYINLLKLDGRWVIRHKSFTSRQ